jgi:hypothetical protein
MITNTEISVDRQLSYVLGLLQNRRERYKLWWNALIGVLAAIGAGSVVALVSGRVSWEAISSVFRNVIVIFLISTILLLVLVLFMYVFLELHLLDDLAERIVFSFCTIKDPRLTMQMLQLIEDPIPIEWKGWKRVELIFTILIGSSIVSAIILVVTLPIGDALAPNQSSFNWDEIFLGAIFFTLGLPLIEKIYPLLRYRKLRRPQTPSLVRFMFEEGNILIFMGVVIAGTELAVLTSFNNLDLAVFYVGSVLMMYLWGLIGYFAIKKCLIYRRFRTIIRQPIAFRDEITT